MVVKDNAQPAHVADQAIKSGCEEDTGLLLELGPEDDWDAWLSEHGY